MRRYQHYGIPTDEKRPDEVLHEVGGFRFYSTPYDANKWRFMWHRFPENHGLPELVTKKPHIAFTVDDLDEEIEGKKILFGPYEPIPGYRVCMIEEYGQPIELIETEMTDEEIARADDEASEKLAS